MVHVCESSMFVVQHLRMGKMTSACILNSEIRVSLCVKLSLFARTVQHACGISMTFDWYHAFGEICIKLTSDKSFFSI